MDPQSSFSSSIFYYYGALLAALLLLFILSSSKINKNKLRYPPSGPLALPLIGHLHLLRDPVHRTLWDIAARHGPLLLLRFGSLPVLLASSAAAAEELLSIHDATFANRPTLLGDKYMAYDRSILSSSPYGPRWRSLRRLASMELLSSARLAALSPIRSQELRLLLRSLLLAYSGEDEFLLVDVRSRLSEITFNVVTRMLDGRRYYGEGGVGEGRRFSTMVEKMFEMASATVPEDFIPALRWLGFGKAYIKKMETLFKEMDELLQAMVDERRRVGTWKKRSSYGDDQEQEEERNMVDGILKLQESDPEYYNDVLIKGMILTFIAAGTETALGTMEWAMALLLNHPDALEKARAEIDTHVGCSRLVTDADLSELRYLNKVIKETLRLYPAGPLLLPHVPSEDCVVGGYHVPRGAMTLVNVYAIQRDPENWSVDSEEFKPERFDGGEAEGFKNIPFGYGRRRCPGEGLALRLMGLTLGALIQCFEWKRIGEEKVDMTEGVGLTMPKAKPLEAMYRPRQAMINVLSQL